jgi:hypothetical protein
MDPVTDPATAAAPAPPADSAPPSPFPPAPAPAPEPAPAPAEGDSRPEPTPPTPPQPGAPVPTPEQQRIAEAQRRMHEATTQAAALRQENLALRGQIDTILGDPRYQAQPLPAAPPGPEGEQWKQLYEEYSKAPGDAEAFGYLLRKSGELAEQRVLARLEGARIQQANLQRQEAQRQQVFSAITTAVQQAAPDVDPQEFWLYTPVAAAETPAHLTRSAERLEWQMARTIEILRAKHQGAQQRIEQSTTQQMANLRAAGAVMPAGAGSGPPRASGGPPSGPGQSLVDAVRALQDRRVTA